MENLQVNQREKKTRHSSRQCRRKGLVPELYTEKELIISYLK